MNEYSSLAYGYRSYEQYTKKKTRIQRQRERKSALFEAIILEKKIITGQLTFSSTFDVNKTSVLLHAIE